MSTGFVYPWVSFAAIDCSLIADDAYFIGFNLDLPGYPLCKMDNLCVVTVIEGSGGSGTSGTSGTSGSGGSGTGGTAGTSGTSGTNGLVGTSGTSGSSGTSGTSGNTGTSGSSGTSGVAGAAGTSGTSGINGTSGTSGIGTVIGPGVSIDENIVIFNGITGNIKDSGINLTQTVTTDGNPAGISPISSSGTWPIELRRIVDGAGTLVQANTGSFQINADPKNSIEIDFLQIQLVGDSASPGNDKYYGTNSGGTRGFHSIPTGGSGTSGTSGTSGIAGTSGSSGTSGVDGTSGSSGTSGIDGTSGTSGATGGSGTSGTSGVNGTSGTSGTSGNTGTSGSSGTSGSAFSPTYMTPWTGSVSNTTVSLNDIDASCVLTFPSTGLYEVVYVLEYGSAAVNTGACFAVDGTTVFDFLQGQVGYDSATGDSATRPFSTFGLNVATASSRSGSLTLYGSLEMRINVTTAGTIYPRFRSEVAGSAITVTSVKGYFRQLA